MASFFCSQCLQDARITACVVGGVVVVVEGDSGNLFTHGQ